jgi:hypothetical protein
MKRTALVLATLACLFGAAVGHAADDMHAHAAAAASALDRLKALDGTWTGTAGDGTQSFPATVSWHVTAAGSAVVETQFVGTPHEMVTVYTLDAGKLVLTHYCAAGNQPRMRARAGTPANELAFDFAGGAGIDPKKDMHMHSARIVFVDADHLHCEWASLDQGKPGHTGIFELARQK